MDKKYVIQSFTIPATGQSFDATNCADINVFNYGTAVLYVNDVIELSQNGTFIASGNNNEGDVTKYRFRFGAGTTKAIVSYRKVLNSTSK